jgi:hypothetical protein
MPYRAPPSWHKEGLHNKTQLILRTLPAPTDWFSFIVSALTVFGPMDGAFPLPVAHRQCPPMMQRAAPTRRHQSAKILSHTMIHECLLMAEAVEELSAESGARNNGIGIGDRLIHCCV